MLFSLILYYTTLNIQTRFSKDSFWVVKSDLFWGVSKSILEKTDENLKCAILDLWIREIHKITASRLKNNIVA